MAAEPDLAAVFFAEPPLPPDEDLALDFFTLLPLPADLDAEAFLAEAFLAAGLPEDTLFDEEVLFAADFFADELLDEPLFAADFLAEAPELFVDDAVLAAGFFDPDDELFADDLAEDDLLLPPDRDAPALPPPADLAADSAAPATAPVAAPARTSVTTPFALS